MVSSVKVTINNDQLKKAIMNSEKIQKLKALSRVTISTGFFDDVTHAAKDGDKEMSVAQLAYIQDVGHLSSLLQEYVPPRPFFTDSVEKTLDIIDDIVTQSIDSQDPANFIGDKIKSIIQTQMTDGGYRENTPFTLKLKDPETRVLFDTGALYDSIETRIESK